MTFWEHLEALRWSLVRVAVVLFVLAIGFFIAMPYIFDSVVLGPTTSDFFLYRWLAGLGGSDAGWRGMLMPDFGDKFAVKIININVASQFMTHMSTAFWFALAVAFPYLIFEIWRFVQPALTARERRNVGWAFAGGTVMFFVGCAVGYAVVFPLAFRFLTQYHVGNIIENQISLNSYMSNFLTLIFVMGIVFELPLLVRLLSRLGLVKRAFLKKYRRHAVIVLLVVAAVITPSGDPFTMMVVFLPLYLLYELGIKLARK